MEEEKKYKISIQGRYRGIEERNGGLDRRTRRLNKAKIIRRDPLAKKIIELLKTGMNTEQISIKLNMKLRRVNDIVVAKRKEADTL